MKKIFSWAGILAAAAMTLVGCAEEIDQPNVDFGAGVPFELTANTADTKTVNDGLATKWAKDDALHVFYAEAGATEYGSNCPFTVSNTETGLFTGTLHTALDASKTYDWYILYTAGEPKYTKSPASKDSNGGYNYIGDSRGLYQEEYGSKAHLVGSACPMYAVVKGHAADQPLEVSMNHITSVIELNITNNTGASLKINSATITVPEVDIVGKYYFDITTSPITLTPNSTYEYAKVNVTSPADLAVGESAKLYFVVRPFTINAGAKWSIQINDTNPVEKTLETSVTFNAGEIHTVNYSVSELSEPEPEPEIPAATIAEFLEAEKSETVWYRLTGTVTNIYNTQYGNFYLVDETGVVCVYGLTEAKVNVNDKSFSKLNLKEGDIVTLIGTRADHNGTPQVGGPAYYIAHEAPVTSKYGVVGTMTQWGSEADIAMSEFLDYYVARGVEMTTSDAFKVRETAKGWDVSYGLSNKIGAISPSAGVAVVAGGQDIYVTTNGTYDIYIDKELTAVYVLKKTDLPSNVNELSQPTMPEIPSVPADDFDADLTGASWSIIGTVVGNWDTDIDLTLDGEWYVARDVEVQAGEFKFRANKGWTHSFGATKSDCYAVIGKAYPAQYNGQNVTIKETGKYDFYLAADYSEFKVCTSGAADLAWTLVSDASSLAAGDQVVIVAKDANKALSKAQNKNNRGEADVTRSDNTVILTENVQILTLEEGTTAGTFAFNTGSGYLYAASSSSNYLKTETTKSANSSWTITIADNTATIKANGANTRNWLRYNSSSSLFAAYASGQGDVCIYKLQ